MHSPEKLMYESSDSLSDGFRACACFVVDVVADFAAPLPVLTSPFSCVVAMPSRGVDDVTGAAAAARERCVDVSVASNVSLAYSAAELLLIVSSLLSLATKQQRHVSSLLSLATK